MKIIAFIFIVLLAFCTLTFFNCQTEAVDTDVDDNNNSVSIPLSKNVKDTTPVISDAPADCIKRVLSNDSPVYSIYNALRNFDPAIHEGEIDRSNVYKLLYDTETLLSGNYNKAVELPAAKVITPPVDFGNNFVYEKAYNDEVNQSGIAINDSTDILNACVTWQWLESSSPNKREVGILELSFNETNGDLTVDFVFLVDYDISSTVSEYNLRAQVIGNYNEHSFKFNYIIGSTTVSTQILGMGISQGEDAYYLAKVKATPLIYFALPATADSTLLDSINIVDGDQYAYLSSEELPVAVDDYKVYVVNTDFMDDSDLIYDLTQLNVGNSREGTWYLDF